MFTSITYCEETSGTESVKKRNEDTDCTFRTGEINSEPVDVDNNESAPRKKRRKKHRTGIAEDDSCIQQANDVDAFNHSSKQKHKKIKRDHGEQKLDDEEKHDDDANEDIPEVENSGASCRRGYRRKVQQTSDTKVSDVTSYDVAKLLSVRDEVHKSNIVNSRNLISGKHSCMTSGLDNYRKTDFGVIVEQTPELNECDRGRTEPSSAIESTSESVALNDSLCALSSPSVAHNNSSKAVQYLKPGGNGSLSHSEGTNVLLEINLEAKESSRALFEKPNETVGGQLIANVTDSLFLADNGTKTSGRKKRRTRRRKSKRASSSLADIAVSKNSVPSPLSEVNPNNDLNGKLDKRHQDSPWPKPASRGHIIFKDDSSSSDSEHDMTLDTSNSVVCEKIENAASMSKQSVSVRHSVLPPITQAVHRSCSDVESSSVTDSPSQCMVLHSASASAPSSNDDSSLRPPANSSTTVTSRLLGEQENGSRSKLNSPFAGVQVFCRQKFKKMPTVCWNENCLPVTAAETKQVTDATCTITESCTRQSHANANDSKEVT